MAEVVVFDGIEEYGCVLHPSQEEAAGVDGIFSPIRHLVKPGETVVIKPNLVADSRIGASDEWVQVITNGAIIERTVQEVVLGLQGKCLWLMRRKRILIMKKLPNASISTESLKGVHVDLRLRSSTSTCERNNG